MSRVFFAIPLVLAFIASPLNAADWPQWRGPDRNEISKETGIRTKFGPGGPKLLWTVDNLGNGYSGPAVVGNTLYILGAAEGNEFAEAINTNSGKKTWRTPLGTMFKNGYGDGPRSTPTVDGDRLYIIRAEGSLHCLDAHTGKLIWEKYLKSDFNGRLMKPGWGFSESPLIDGDHLICTPGGAEGSIICLDKNNGEIVWRCKDVTDDAAYSSIIAADVNGVRQYIQVVQRGVVGVRASDGKLLWYYSRPGQKVAVIPTAVYADNCVYVTAGYNAGCALIKLSRAGDKFQADEVYADQALVNHHGGVILVDGCIYGHSYQGPNKTWVCQDFKTGKIKSKWEGKGVPGKGSITYANGRFFCYDERNGNLFCAEASPSGWKSDGMLALPKRSTNRSPRGGIWTHPVIANGKLFLRDQDLLFCFDIKE